jgi:hypothetical protein
MSTPEGPADLIAKLAVVFFVIMVAFIFLLGYLVGSN